MATTLPPDPYAALGVPRDADSSLIKSTYRKLVLKCHPDKVTDASLKQQKQEEFHKIQQAYELIGDEEKRGKYDAEVQLEKMREQIRKEKAARGGNPTTATRTAHYDVRTQAPAGAQAAFDARGPSRYETPKSSSRAYDDDRYYESRRYDTYEAYPKHASSRSSRSKEEPVKVTKISSDRARSDNKKSRDKEERRERSGKYAPYVSMEEESSSADEKARFEREYRRREEEEDARRRAAESRRKAEDRRSYDEPRRHRSSDEDDMRKQKLTSQKAEAMHYIGRAREEADRPSPSRQTSSRDVRPEYYERKASSRREERPEVVRRSSGPRTKERPSASARERKPGMPEIVEWGSEERTPPSFSKSASSPADIQIPRATPSRSYTDAPRESRRADTSPTPAFRRSETMPSVHTTSSRRKEASARPSGLRSSETATYEPGYSSSSPPKTSYPTVPQPQSSSTTSRKVYHYPSTGGGVQLSPDDMGVANGHQTITREPQRRTRSPEAIPLSRPPMGPNRVVEPRNIPPPPLGRSATLNVSPSRGGEDRGRSRKLYGEITPDAARDRLRENARNQTSYSPDRVNYAKKIGPEDIRWSRGREADRDHIKPGLTRHATYVY